MAITDKERQEAVAAVRWLRRCQDSSDVESHCWSCPYEGKNCIRLLKEISAELIEQFAEEIAKREIVAPACALVCNDTVKDAKLIATWLWHCCERDKQKTWCDMCPCNDSERNCMDYLQTRAADILEQLIKLS